jgi:hypothetical protein
MTLFVSNAPLGILPTRIRPVHFGANTTRAWKVFIGLRNRVSTGIARLWPDESCIHLTEEARHFRRRGAVAQMAARRSRAQGRGFESRLVRQ